MTEDATGSTVGERLARVRSDIEGLGVDPGTVDIVAVTKRLPVTTALDALEAGLRDVGENYAQELVAKATAPELTDRPEVRWHAIGHLQRNKVRVLAPHVTLWQTLDRAALATEIAKRAPGAQVLVQVNVSGEAQKSGCRPDEVSELVDAAGSVGLQVEGLMTVATLGGGPSAAREFARLRTLVDDHGLTTCSMGMSGDYLEAVAEGATMLRLGTVLFGPRPGG